MTPNAERPAIVIPTAAELTNIQDDMWAPEGTKSGFAIFLVFLAVIGGFLGLLFASLRRRWAWRSWRSQFFWQSSRGLFRPMRTTRR